LHHRAVWIHPFENGNGRWGRLLADIWQYSRAGLVTTWPEAGIGEVSSSVREECLEALQAVDNSDFDPLIAMHERFTGPM
jgi:fido (protein-threonine AMPylation protein)